MGKFVYVAAFFRVLLIIGAILTFPFWFLFYLLAYSN